ncbi:serine/threonine-protein kinase [Nocardia sp. NPDC050378]|uniref:serine/threonine-protein kinase n=1 Tax=Nocardia sp. NPDC050378 TaxID=3155400 RepID=UPI0033FF67E3
MVELTEVVAVQPQVVGDRYELLEQVGSGGMGLVYAGFDRHLKRRIAVKFTQPSLHSDPGWTKRFFREAEVMARLSHPGLPAIHDAGVIAGKPERPYLVMEFVEGVTFEDLLADHGSLPVGVVASLGAQTAAVLAATHGHHIYHRDLKPSNLMLCSDGTVKVLDFGLAVVLDGELTRYTSTGATLGTPAFMAPEQVEGKPVVAQTDLYSLGLVLHELLTGTRVMTGGTPFVVWQNQIHRPAPDIETLCADVPADMAALLMSMLAKSPSRRPRDASEVHGVLLPHAAGLDALPQVNGLYGPARMYASAVSADGQAQVAVESRLVTAEDLAVTVVVEDRDSLRKAMDRTHVLPAVDAVTQLNTVVEAASSVLGAEDPEVVEARTRLAELRAAAGDDLGAAELYRTLVTELTAERGPYDDAVLNCQRRLAACDVRIGDTSGALGRLRKLHTQMAIRYGEQDRRVIELAAEIRAIEIN